MTDYIIPEVTLEEADTITLDIFGSPQTLEGFTERIRLILTEDRRRVASLQDPWVEVPQGTVIPEGVRYRVEEGKSAHEYVSSNEWLVVDTGTYTAFVHRSDLPKVAPPKSRRDRLIDEVIKASGWHSLALPDEWIRVTVWKWIDRVESAVKVVDGDE